MRYMSILLLLSTLGCRAETPVAGEHGYKTSVVTATRYKNPMMGYNIGFELAPRFWNVADRVEVDEFFTSNHCHIYEGGGYPGAVTYAICDGVTDADSANKKLLEFLPKLSAFMKRLK